MTLSKFEKKYPKIEDKINFLSSFNLINLQKAGKIGKISIKKMTQKSQAIKSILGFDIKNKFLICKTMFNNPNEYLKEKIDEVYTFKTQEWNQYQYDNMETQEWEQIKNELTSELNMYKNQAQTGKVDVNNRKIEDNFEIPLKLDDLDDEILKKNSDTVDTKAKLDDNMNDSNDITTTIDPRRKRTILTTGDIQLNTNNIKKVSLNSNRKNFDVERKVTNQFLNSKRTKKNLLEQIVKQSEMVKEAIRKYDELKRIKENEIKRQETIAKAKIELQRQQEEYKRKKRYQEFLNSFKIEKNKRHMVKVADTIKLTIHKCNISPNYNYSYTSPPHWNPINNNHNSVWAKREIDRFNYIDEFDYKEDPYRNRKVLTFKGR